MNYTGRNAAGVCGPAGYDYKKNLNKEQYEAVCTTEGPVLILAGAGSGKTRTIIHCVAYLVDNGIPPENILLLTFTNKAADEMKQRAAAMSGDKCGRVMACTYHSFCARMLRIYHGNAGLIADFSIITNTDGADIISRIKAEKNYNRLRMFPKSSVIINMISSSVNRSISLTEVLGEEKYFRYRQYEGEILDIAKSYDDYKRSRYLLDYDDLLIRFLDMIKNCEPVRRRISAQYKYIMVDEYQDTNSLQDEIVFTLRKENRNLAVVGDDSQSIYAFRGADIKNIINFPKRMPGCREIALVKNYRSNQHILDLANYIINTYSTEGYPKMMSAVHNRGERPQLVCCSNQFQEAEAAYRIIMNLNAQGIPMKEIAVIYRSSWQAARLELILSSEKIGYEKYGGIRFLEMSCVLDVLAYLRVLSNAYDEIAWYRILKIYGGVGQKYSQVISGGATSKGSRILIDHPYKKRKFAKTLEEFYGIYNEWLKINGNDRTGEIVKNVIDHYIDTRKKACMNMKTSDEGIRDEMMKQIESDEKELGVLVDMAAPYKTPAAFLDSIVLDQTAGTDKKEDNDSLVLTTVHSAKGLEFTAVLLLDCVDGIFPSMREGTQEEENEELRCMYVAVTRAKEYLYMFCPDEVSIYGRTEIGCPSHFLDNTDLYDQKRYRSERKW